MFGAHAKTSARGGFENFLSDVKIDEISRTVTITPRPGIRRSDGTPYTLDDATAAIKASVSGTRHSFLAPLVNSVEETKTSIVLHFRSISVNIRYLLILADFYMTDAGSAPVTPTSLPASTGAYSLAEMSRTEITLKRNLYFPADERANEIDTVHVHGFAAKDASTLIQSMDTSTHHLAYLYGFGLVPRDYETLEKKGYTVELYPSDWLVYVSFGHGTARDDRVLIASVLDKARSRLTPKATNGQTAYSTTPTDRPFSLSQKEYQASAPRPRSRSLSRPLTLTTLDEWSSLPLFAAVIKELQNALPELTVKTVSRSEMKSIYQSDVWLSPIGQTPADPLTHLSFLVTAKQGIDGVLSRDEISEISAIEDAKTFVARVKDIERRILSERVMVPLFHFPGVLVTSPLVEKDARLASNWGIQAWTYHIK